MRTQHEELQFLAILRAKIKAIADKDFFDVKGFLSPGQAVQAYKEAEQEWREQQAKVKQPHSID